MKNFRASQQAFSILEYIIVILLVIGGLITFRGYIQRAYQGQMMRVGETFAFGRQYDPNKTMVCAYDDKVHVWYSQACYEQWYVADNCQTSDNSDGCSHNAMKKCNEAACQIN